MSLAEISGRLIDAGLDRATPSAAMRWVTRGDQQVVTGTLGDLPAKVGAMDLRPPALVVIGEIVKLREQIDWFDKLPLRGQSIVVTRAASQSFSFCEQLRRLGANVIAIPTIAFEEPWDWEPADTAIRNLSNYDLLVFTSVNGVDRFLRRLDASQHDLRNLPTRICAIGPATANRVQGLHLQVDVLPEEFVAESLVEALKGLGLDGCKVLLPRAQEARELLPAKLTELGAEVDVVPVYRTVLPEGSRKLAEEAWQAGRAPRLGHADQLLHRAQPCQSGPGRGFETIQDRFDRPRYVEDRTRARLASSGGGFALHDGRACAGPLRSCPMFFCG